MVRRPSSAGVVSISAGTRQAHSLSGRLFGGRSDEGSQPLAFGCCGAFDQRPLFFRQLDLNSMPAGKTGDLLRFHETSLLSSLRGHLFAPSRLR
jgi:hypothetical protein